MSDGFQGFMQRRFVVRTNLSFLEYFYANDAGRMGALILAIQWLVRLLILWGIRVRGGRIIMLGFMNVGGE